MSLMQTGRRRAYSFHLDQAADLIISLDNDRAAICSATMLNFG